MFRPSHVKQGCSTLVRSGETQVSRVVRNVPVFAGEMMSLRIASDACEVETVELALLGRHRPNGWLVLEEAPENHLVCGRVSGQDTHLSSCLERLSVRTGTLF